MLVLAAFSLSTLTAVTLTQTSLRPDTGRVTFKETEKSSYTLFYKPYTVFKTSDAAAQEFYGKIIKECQDQYEDLQVKNPEENVRHLLICYKNKIVVSHFRNKFVFDDDSCYRIESQLQMGGLVVPCTTIKHMFLTQ